MKSLEQLGQLPFIAAGMAMLSGCSAQIDAMKASEVAMDKFQRGIETVCRMERTEGGGNLCPNYGCGVVEGGVERRFVSTDGTDLSDVDCIAKQGGDIGSEKDAPKGYIVLCTGGFDYEKDGKQVAHASCYAQYDISQ